jgi:hypothetical protein
MRLFLKNFFPHENPELGARKKLKEGEEIFLWRQQGFFKEGAA